MERVSNAGNDETRKGGLRGFQGHSHEDDGNSHVLVHLALDTPPQIWTFAVKEGPTRGSWVLPDCAAPVFDPYTAESVETSFKLINL